MESVQYDAALAIAGSIGGTCTEKRYQELGFQSMMSRICFQKLSHFYKIIRNETPSYLLGFPINNYGMETK